MSASLEMVIQHGANLTLADIGEVVGLSAATIVQRFGTKRDLLLGASKLWARRAEAVFDSDGTPLDRLIAGMTQLAGWLQTPEQAANVAGSLYIDIVDDEFREVLKMGLLRQRTALCGLLDEAIATGELQSCDTVALARSLQNSAFGARQVWSIDPEGTLADWVESCLRTTLAPWIPVSDDDLVTA